MTATGRDPEKGRFFGMTQEEKCFGLGAGRLYVAPASTPEAEMHSLNYYAGPTKGGVQLSYAAKIHEITDYAGVLVRSIRYGERVRLSGRMARLYPRVLAAASGSRLTGDELFPGALTAAGRSARVRVLLVCPLPAEAGGGEMRFSMIASAASGFSFLLSPQRDSSYDFTLTAETDGAGFSGKLVFR